jgi:hypothetical protein
LFNLVANKVIKAPNAAVAPDPIEIMIWLKALSIQSPAANSTGIVVVPRYQYRFQ